MCTKASQRRIQQEQKGRSTMGTSLYKHTLIFVIGTAYKYGATRSIQWQMVQNPAKAV